MKIFTNEKTEDGKADILNHILLTEKQNTDMCIEETNFHSLRHTFATHCIEIGFDAKTLSEILGHSSVNITLNRYVHSSMKMKQESMNKLVVGM